MIRNTIWLLALLILLVIQGGILQPLHISPANLILIVVALSTILSEFRQGVAITLMGGLILDFASGSPDGIITMSLLAVFLALHLLLREFLSREPNGFILAATIAGGTILYYIVFIAAGRIFEIFGLIQKPDLGYLLSLQLPLAIIWNLAFAYPIYHYYLLAQKLASKARKDEDAIKV